MREEGAANRKPSLRTGALGAQVISLLVPCLLMWWTNTGGLPIFSDDDWSLTDLTLLAVTAIILCGPGTLVFGMALVALLRRKAEKKGEALKRSLIKRGTAIGALLAFLNVPAYLGFLHVGSPSFLPILGLGGAMAGAWIGWRVYGRLEPPQPFWPPFSLATLVAFVLGWAVLFILYAPRAW